MAEQKNIPDKVLIESLLKGDIQAFDEIFKKYSQKLYGFSLRYLKSEVESEGLVQNVFVKIWENRKSIKKETSFKSYLFTIAYHEILKFFRTQAYHYAYVRESLAIANDSDKSSEKYDYASILEEIDKLIEKLPEKRRIIFIKSRKDGLSSKEIAAQLNISPGTVDNNISEALKFLRQNLNSEVLGLVLYFTLFLQ